MISRTENQEERLLVLMRRLLDIAPDTSPSDICRQNLPEWDSLRHVKLMLEIQRDFGIRFSSAEIVKMSSFEEIRLALESK